jgi:metal-responsive CopG/Arc/MetJ family transcriptional regulator
MKNIKTITISLPIEMGNDIQKMAKEEHRTISELVREAFRQYKAQRVFAALAQQGQEVAKMKKLKPEDFNLR